MIVSLKIPAGQLRGKIDYIRNVYRCIIFAQKQFHPHLSYVNESSLPVAIGQAADKLQTY
jgi:hypothetical protein